MLSLCPAKHKPAFCTHRQVSPSLCSYCRRCTGRINTLTASALQLHQAARTEMYECYCLCRQVCQLAWTSLASLPAAPCSPRASQPLQLLGLGHSPIPTQDQGASTGAALESPGLLATALESLLSLWSPQSKTAHLAWTPLAGVIPRPPAQRQSTAVPPTSTRPARSALRGANKCKHSP